MTDRETRLSEEFPPIGPDVDIRWLARELREVRKSQARSERQQVNAIAANSSIADRVGKLEVARDDHENRLGELERSSKLPVEGRRRRRWFRMPAFIALVAFVLGAGGLALVVALITRTRSS